MNEIKLGWLSPTAEMVECNAYEHISTAYDFVAKTGGEISKTFLFSSSAFSLL